MGLVKYGKFYLIVSNAYYYPLHVLCLDLEFHILVDNMRLSRTVYHGVLIILYPLAKLGNTFWGSNADNPEKF